MPPELESSFQLDNPHPDQPQQDIAAIAELLSPGDEAEPEQQEATDAPESDDQLQETAEQGEHEEAPQEDADEAQEAQQVDYDLEIPMPDGIEAMTVGQLKDHFRDHQDLQQERDDWEAQQSEQQLQLMAARRQLVALADMLKDVKPEIVDHVQQMQQRNDEQEQMLLLQTFPAWSDPEKKAAARTEQLNTAKQYGFSEWEYSSVGDHRLIKLLHDLTQYRKREAAGKAKREELKAASPPKGQKPQTRKQTAAQKRAALVERARRGTETEKMTAIGSLISEG